MRIAVILSLFALVAGCGASGEQDPAVESGTIDTVVAGHIHGLGVDPGDGALYVATHSGLFRAPPGEARAELVGTSRQDTMGFTVAGPREFLGSGHPDNPDQPPLLGLIRSRDGGRSWESVSLSGEADFHVLRAAGRRVYGFDATQGRLMVSDDGGAGWKERRPPAAMFDLAIDPEDADHVVVATEQGLAASSNAGKSWRALDGKRAGLLAWGDRGLILIEGQGGVLRSTDAGRGWDSVGNVGGQPAALSLDDGLLHVGLHSNEVKVSQDGGRSWQPRATL